MAPPSPSTDRLKKRAGCQSLQPAPHAHATSSECYLQLALTMLSDVTFIGPIFMPPDIFIPVSLPILLSLILLSLILSPIMLSPDASPTRVTVWPTWFESGTEALVTQCFLPDASVTE